MLLKAIIYSIALTLSLIVHAQEKYPKNYFGEPLDIPIILSGTFGELRSNHFHSGLDIKTQQREGFKVYTIADGYVSRIKYSNWGYGKAIYVTHPNGYTSVYAHLQKAGGEIEKFIKSKQYEQEKFDIQVYPGPQELKVKKGDVIAYTGSTGGSAGPHLHFEIRNTATSKPINPLHFGYSIADHKAPIVQKLVAYPRSKDAIINKVHEPIEISIKKQADGVLLADKIDAIGTIAFGVNTFDRLDGAMNKNGIYRLKMTVNGATYYDCVMDEFSFSESRYINLLIDYERYATIKQRVHKCHMEEEDILSIYQEEMNKGLLTVEDGMHYTVEITAYDFDGNTKLVRIPIQGKSIPSFNYPSKSLGANPIPIHQNNTLKKENVTVTFPAYSFYQDAFVDFEVSDNIAVIHKPTIPLKKKYSISFDISNLENKKHLFIAKKSSKGYWGYSSTKRKGNTLTTSTKNLGTYAIKTDSIAPVIKAHNFKKDQWLSNYSYLKIKISDNFSGIKSYRGTINGEWVLLEYNTKKGILSYNFNDKKFTESKLNLKLVVKDNAGNTKTYQTTFNRKEN